MLELSFMFTSLCMLFSAKTIKSSLNPLIPTTWSDIVTAPAPEPVKSSGLL